MKTDTFTYSGLRPSQDEVRDGSMPRNKHTLTLLLVFSVLQWMTSSGESVLSQLLPGQAHELTALQYITGTVPADPLSETVHRDQATQLLAFAREGSDHIVLIENLERDLTQILWSALHLLEDLGPEATHRASLLRVNETAINSALRDGPEGLERDLEDAFNTDAPAPTEITPPRDWAPMTDSPAAWKAWRAWVESDPLRHPGNTLLDFTPQATVAALITDQREHVEQDPHRRAYRLAHARALLSSATKLDQVWVELQERLVQEALTQGRGHPLRQSAKRGVRVKTDEMPIELFLQHVRTARQKIGPSPQRGTGST